MSDLIADMVHEAYWRDDVNCATTMLRVLARMQNVDLSPQLLAAATGMHGAGCYGAQCGLVEGGLLFIGLWAGEQGLPVVWVEETCRAYARGFEQGFGSLLCRDLRPQGFAPDQPPHLCEGLSCRAVSWAVDFIGYHCSSRQGGEHGV